MSRWFDVVVIGAGPAGSMAAYEVASAGYSVLLLEKHKKPGRPLCCAEGVSQPSLEKLIKPLPEWISASISKIHLVAPSGFGTTIRHAAAGYVLDRTRFDYDLAERAVGAGGILECEAIGLELKKSGEDFDTLDVLRPDGTVEQIKANIFIAADGVESKIARLAGINNLIETDDIESLLQYRVENINIDPETVDFVLGNKIAPRGYAWVFPKSENSANVGLGISVAAARGAQTAEYLNKFLKSRFGKYRVVEKFCGIVPHYQGIQKFRMRNLLVVGDAARSLDSLSGAGIINGMLSGKYAGFAAAEYLTGKFDNIEEIEKLYPGKFLAEKGRELIMYSKLREIYNRFNDDDFEDIVRSIDNKFNGKDINHVDPIKVLTGIIMSRPRLIRLVRYLL